MELQLGILVVQFMTARSHYSTIKNGFVKNTPRNMITNVLSLAARQIKLMAIEHAHFQVIEHSKRPILTVDRLFFSFVIVRVSLIFIYFSIFISHFFLLYLCRYLICLLSLIIL